LNTKLAKVRVEANSLKARFENEDMEKENDIKNKVEEKLNDCDKDINGDRAERNAEETQKNIKPMSL